MTAIVADLHLEPDNETELLHAFEETLELITEHDPSELVILCDVVQESRPSTDRRLLVPPLLFLILPAVILSRFLGDIPLVTVQNPIFRTGLFT
jgi:metallophosphoesterase superfamily enzyme